ncbi:MAG: BatA domain-containing protein, partial [Candidatus Brocadiae bacterium]|nr:BatA domain-containing protein [Candidatus Brocadiia bacterium]
MHLLWASLAIPVLIHLVHRRKAKRVPFSTLRFLQMVDLRVARRQRLKELLLLALRMLLLAVLIAALYRPLIRSATFKGTDVPTAVAVVLDNTYSMRAAAGRTLRFAHAKEAADDVLEGLQTGDCAAIVLLDAQEDTPPEPTTDLNSLRQSLAGLECGYGTAELAGAVRRALQGLDQSTLPRKELYVVTDFQRLCWTPALAELHDAFPPDLSVFLVDVGTEVGSNLALTSADFGVNVQVAGAAAELYCGLRNFGRRHVEKQLSLFLDGEKVAHRDVALAPGAEMVASFSHVFGRTGDFAGEVSLESDELDA